MKKNIKEKQQLIDNLEKEKAELRDLENNLAKMKSQIEEKKWWEEQDKKFK